MKPITFFDLETTSTDPKTAKIIEIAIIRIENGEYMMNFGKHKGTKAKECKSYLSWMLQQDFMPDTKAIIVKILAEK